MGGEAGGVEEDTEVGVKAFAHLSLSFLCSPTPSRCDTAIQPRVGTPCLDDRLISLGILYLEENSNTCVKCCCGCLVRETLLSGVVNDNTIAC